MAKKRSASEWVDRIDSVQQLTKYIREAYRKYVRMYRGDQWAEDQLIAGMDAIVVNYIFNSVRTQVPTLYNKNPRIFTHATRPEYVNTVPLVNSIANYDWRILKIKDEFKRGILRAKIGGISFFQTGYTYEEEEVKEPKFDEEGKEIPEAPISHDPRIIKDSPFVICRSLLDTVFDPFANVLQEMAWWGVNEMIPIERARKQFNNNKLKPNAKFDDIVVNKLREEYRKHEDLECLEVWHIADLWAGKFFTIARGNKNKIKEIDLPVGYKLRAMFFDEDPESAHHLSAVKIVEHQQQEINKIRTFEIEHIKRMLPKLFYDKNQIRDAETKEQITNGQPWEYIGVDGNPSAAVQAAQFPPIPVDMYNVEKRLKDDINLGTGLSDFQRGVVRKVPSATEASLIEQSSRLRIDENADMVADVAEDVSKAIFQLRQEFTTEDKVLPIIGQDGLPNWNDLASYSKDDIKGDYEFTVEYGSTQKRDQDFEKALWGQVGPMLGQLAQSQLPAHHVLGEQIGKAYEIPEPILKQIFPLAGQPPPQMGPQMGGPQMGAPPNPSQIFGGGGA